MGEGSEHGKEGVWEGSGHGVRAWEGTGHGRGQGMGGVRAWEGTGHGRGQGMGGVRAWEGSGHGKEGVWEGSGHGRGQGMGRKECGRGQGMGGVRAWRGNLDYLSCMHIACFISQLTANTYLGCYHAQGTILTQLSNTLPSVC